MSNKRNHEEEFSGEFGQMFPQVQQEQQAKGFKELFEKGDKDKKKTEKKKNNKEKK
ncbi:MULTISPECIES: hypothetical protein [Shouchella]|uniref:YfhE-like protein n=2 Tax=Shouchella TaxID=2893057 RepID=A0ABY7W4B2_9BACI|nr:MULTISPECIES: hypothetical protein [Shouchella]MED4127312.1 hypothetical protein [Shouchella miscanthi]WDF03787.1 hypothetical protein PQ477_20220 [Shouchella hunanensis]GAF23342.1 hypothetical protein JCM19047_3159 [Bacillus sp. JCM 19047]